MTNSSFVDHVEPSAYLKGRVQGWHVRDTGRFYTPMYVNSKRVMLPGHWTRASDIVHNQFLYDWARIFQNLLRGSPDGKNYSIAGMYLEFENNGGATINPVPTIARTGNKAEYYDTLHTGDPKRDYLRVPLVATASSLSDANNFDGDNVFTAIAMSQGVTGVHGNTFSDSVSSRIYGGALVAMPGGTGDATQDLVLSRMYLSGSNQINKQAGSQIALTWSVVLG